ncbi:MAG: hypothetical protein ACKVOI_00350 [Dongiaceae bacterium]
MSSEFTSVKLSSQELFYLGDSGLPTSEQIDMAEPVAPDAQTRVIQFSNIAARRIGDALTARLALHGFDEKYELTPEGRLIEDLIDKFFV